MSTFPAMPGPAREAAVLEYVRKGIFRPITWSWLELKSGEHVGRIAVMSDALALGNGEDFVRVNMTCRTQQLVADMLGFLLITPKVSDAIFASAMVKITPCLQTPDDEMMQTHRMIRHHDEVEAKRRGMPGLVSTVGKDWVLTNKLIASPTLAANYGWHDPKAPYAGKWQPVGMRHNVDYTDYSQVCRLMRPTMIVDGSEMGVGAVLRNPALCGLLSNEGVMQITRHPGIRVQRFETIRPPDHEVEADVLEPNSEPDLHIEKIQARNYTKASGRAIDLIVIHTMEAIEKPGTAEAVAKWFAGANAPRASCHYCVDQDSIVRCVDDGDVAWHAPGANNNGIGIEHAGYAKQSAGDWADDASRSMLALSAALTAQLCDAYKIPVEFVDAKGLVEKRRGITTHAEVSKAFKKSNHWDPGGNFPMTAYLDAVKARLLGKE